MNREAPPCVAVGRGAEIRLKGGFFCGMLDWTIGLVEGYNFLYLDFLSNWTLKNRAFKGSIKAQYHYEVGCATTEVHFGSANGIYALWGKMHENEEVLMGLNGHSIVNLVYMFFFFFMFL